MISSTLCYINKKAFVLYQLTILFISCEYLFYVIKNTSYTTVLLVCVWSLDFLFFWGQMIRNFIDSGVNQEIQRFSSIWRQETSQTGALASQVKTSDTLTASLAIGWATPLPILRVNLHWQESKVCSKFWTYKKWGLHTLQTLDPSSS